MEEETEGLREKIAYYENEGRLSTLLKKVMKLEEETKKLYAKISEKDKHIKDLKLESLIEKKEIKRLAALYFFTLESLILFF